MMLESEKNTIKNELFNIWKCCFGDEDSVINCFLDCVYEHSICVFERRDGKIVSALYLIPCEFRSEKCFYLYAAATLPQYRKQGIMSSLVRRATDTARLHGAAFIYLFPANDGLYEYYGALGFTQVLTAAYAEEKTEALPDMPEAVQCGVVEFFKLLCENAESFHAPVFDSTVLPYISELYSDMRFAYCKENGRVSALVACDVAGDTAKSLFADAADGCVDLMLSLCTVFQTNKIAVTAPSCLLHGGQMVKNGMIMPLCGSDYSEAGFYVGFNMF